MTETSATKCVAAVRRMILTGKLFPGEKLHQEQLARLLNMSRVPVREALSTLESEGLVMHRANTGYAVARFSKQDLEEIYLMRRLLESELLRSYDITLVDVPRMRRLNDQLAEVPIDQERELFDRLNQDFHFALFEPSPMLRVRDEVERLWRLSTFYRALSWNGPEAQARVVAEHERIIEAVESADPSVVVSACDSHRGSTSAIVATLNKANRIAVSNEVASVPQTGVVQR